MLRLGILGLLLVSCAGAPIGNASKESCLTRCGLRADSQCENLQALENKVIAAFERYARIPAAKTCAAFSGWYVRPHVRVVADHDCQSTYAWSMGTTWTGPLCVIGYTHEGGRWVEVPNSNWLKNPLPHELVHVVDLYLTGVVGHCAWKERGIKDALKAVRGIEDESEPEGDCPTNQKDSGQLESK